MQSIAPKLILAVVLADKRVGHYYPQDLAALIELGLLGCEAPVYHYLFKKWLPAEDLKEVRDLLSPHALNRLGEKKRFIEPEFLPPPPPLEPAFTLSDFTLNTASKVDELKERERELEEQVSKLTQANRESKQEAQQLQDEVTSLKQEVKNWQDQAWNLKEELEQVKSSFESLKEENEEIRIGYESLKNAKEDDEYQFVGIEEKLKDALTENNKLAKAIKRLGRDKSRLLNYLADLEKQLNGALHSREVLKKDLKKKEVDLVKMKKREAKAKKIIKSLDSVRNTVEAAREVDLKRLIGESFEVSNEPIWHIKRSGEQKGPYRFSDVN